MAHERHRVRIGVGNVQVRGRRLRPVLGLSAGVVVGSLLIAGCTAAGSASTATQLPGPSQAVPSSTPAGTPPELLASVASGAAAVAPGDPITVAAVHGAINDVKLVDAAGTPVAGTMDVSATKWTSSNRLDYGTTYTLVASAIGSDAAHLPVNATTTFSTAKPRTLTMPYLSVNNGDVVGIGEPIAVKFDEEIADKAAAVKAIVVTTTPRVEGAFYWFNNKEVRWRPENFWAPGTKVTVDVNTYGHNLGDATYGEDDVHVAFGIGDKVVSTVDDSTKILSVAVNDVVVKTMPTSMGKNSTPTEHGVFTIGEKHASMIMDSTTFGLPSTAPGGYKVTVKWATRMSFGGVFVHSAPWSLSDQGVRNVSHGCLNVSPANAEWFYNLAKPGDLVIVTGTKGPLLGGTEGLGDWNIPWSTWKAGGAV